MPSITPHLWYDKEAAEAAAFYSSLFENSRTKSHVTLHNPPPFGDAYFVTIDLAGQEFQLISAGPLFQFNPSISFLVNCASREEVDRLWARLSDGGSVMMELGEYPFSPHYGWLADRYGLSWQLMHRAAGPIGRIYPPDRPAVQKLIPTVMFVGEVCGRAEEAMKFWTSLFEDGSIGEIARYEGGHGPDAAGTVMHGSFTLAGQQFAAMDSAYEHKFAFNEAISFIVNCATQEEIDHFWYKLSADPSAEQCGWLKDRFGVSWQVVPAGMEELLNDQDPERTARVTAAVLGMKKMDIAQLEAAYAGQPA
ncbi:MAG: VOC family protein [Chloroflexi bacterium CFX6]|nr:VOC family protein [Chloroflexi bacterium CFX6]